MCRIHRQPGHSAAIVGLKEQNLEDLNFQTAVSEAPSRLIKEVNDSKNWTQ